MVKSTSTSLALIEQKVVTIEEDVRDIRIKLDSNYATKEWCNAEYGETKKIVNGFLIAFGLGLVAAIVAFVIGGGLK